MAVNKQHYIRVQGELVEVSDEVYLTYYRMERRARYLDEKDNQHGKVLFGTLDIENIPDEDALPGQTAERSVEDSAIAAILKDKLYRSLEQLTAPEQELIRALDFEGLTERQFSNRTGVPQRTVNDRRRRALTHLRKIFGI